MRNRNRTLAAAALAPFLALLLPTSVWSGANETPGPEAAAIAGQPRAPTRDEA